VLKVIYGIKGLKGANLIGKSPSRMVSSGNLGGITRGLSNLFDPNLGLEKEKKNRDKMSPPSQE